MNQYVNTLFTAWDTYNAVNQTVPPQEVIKGIPDSIVFNAKAEQVMDNIAAFYEHLNDRHHKKLKQYIINEMAKRVKSYADHLTQRAENQSIN